MRRFWDFWCEGGWVVVVLALIFGSVVYLTLRDKAHQKRCLEPETITEWRGDPNGNGEVLPSTRTVCHRWEVEK
jgi:hypothetical protein